jgi:Fe-Mn family superoxide dismutase
MTDFTRRELIQTAAVGLATAGVSRAGLASEGSTMETILAFQGQHKPKPLAFDPKRLRGISEKLIVSHWENNYGGAVKALNAVELQLAQLIKDKNLPPYIYGDIKREQLVRTGSVVLHELYFGNLGGDGKSGGEVQKALIEWFGSIDTWADDFRKTALSLSGGPGWVTLSFNQNTGALANYWSWDHMHNAPMGFPLLVLDMYEHSYHMDYGAAAAKYLDAFIDNTQWEVVNERYLRARKFAELSAKV